MCAVGAGCSVLCAVCCVLCAVCCVLDAGWRRRGNTTTQMKMMGVGAEDEEHDWSWNGVEADLSDGHEAQDSGLRGLVRAQRGNDTTGNDTAGNTRHATHSTRGCAVLSSVEGYRRTKFPHGACNRENMEQLEANNIALHYPRESCVARNGGRCNTHRCMMWSTELPSHSEH